MLASSSQNGTRGGQRRLSAFLMADVEGYSRMVGVDEPATLNTLKNHRAILERTIAENHGRLFSAAGDGFMAEFASAADAVKSAVKAQKAIRQRNKGRPVPLWFRMGIALGEIVDDGHEIHGNAINTAVRVQTLSEPGGICVTHAVYEEVANKLPYGFEDVGEVKLKNLPRPVRVHRVRWADLPPHLARGLPSALEDAEGGVVVLPFDDYASGDGQRYLANGLTEDITTELARCKLIPVISKNSSLAYEGRRVDARLIARELGARYIVQGSIKRKEARIRINVQLISGAGGEHIWADRFEGSLEDVFEVQDNVVRGIVNALEPNLRNAEIERARRKPPASWTAYDYYLQALPLRAAVEAEANEKALLLLEKAIALDPQLAPALAHAGACYMARRDQGWRTVSAADVARCLELANAAVEADFNHPTALCLSAHAIASVGDDTRLGVSLMDRSLRLNPSSAEAWARSAMVRLYAEDHDLAEHHAERAIALGPIDSTLYLPLCALAYSYLFKGRYREAIDMAQHAVLGRQKPPMAFLIMLAAHYQLGEMHLAESALERLKSLAPALGTESEQVLRPFKNQDHQEVIRAAMRAFGLGETSEHAGKPPVAHVQGGSRP